MILTALCCVLTKLPTGMCIEIPRLGKDSCDLRIISKTRGVVLERCVIATPSVVLRLHNKFVRLAKREIR